MDVCHIGANFYASLILENHRSPIVSKWATAYKLLLTSMNS